MADKIELDAAGIEAALEAYADRLPFGLRDSAKGAEALRAAIADAVTAYLSASKAVPEEPVAEQTPGGEQTVGLRAAAAKALKCAEIYEGYAGARNAGAAAALRQFGADLEHAASMHQGGE